MYSEICISPRCSGALGIGPAHNKVALYGARAFLMGEEKERAARAYIRLASGKPWKACLGTCAGAGR